MTKKSSIPASLQVSIPARFFIRFVIWSRLTRLTQKLYRKVNWRLELVDIAIHNHMNQQFRNNQQLKDGVSYPPKK